MKNKKPMKDLPEVKLFNKYIDDKPIALAVSGGPDSTAMMQIAAFSEKIKNINVTVIVVDHGLRKESKNETKIVSQNAVNEILVDQYINKRIPFTSFYKYILQVLKDRNYRKYAIKEPKSISQILQIDQWSRKVVYRKILTNKNV